MTDDVERWERLRREADELFERTVALQDRFAAADRELKANDSDLKAAIAHGDSRKARDLNNAAQALRLEFVDAHRALGKVIEQAIAAQHRAFNAAPLELRESYQRATLEVYRRRGLVPSDSSDTPQ